MKRANIILPQDKYINVPADRMEVSENLLYVYNEKDLTALVDVSVILSAHISERGESFENNH
jgi:hypothetical protein